MVELDEGFEAFAKEHVEKLVRAVSESWAELGVQLTLYVENILFAALSLRLMLLSTDLLPIVNVRLCVANILHSLPRFATISAPPLLFPVFSSRFL